MNKMMGEDQGMLSKMYIVLELNLNDVYLTRGQFTRRTNRLPIRPIPILQPPLSHQTSHLGLLQSAPRRRSRQPARGRSWFLLGREDHHAPMPRH